jgi:hypothetical protein
MGKIFRTNGIMMCGHIFAISANTNTKFNIGLWDEPHPGMNGDYQWMRKHEYNKFRHKAKHMIQKAKYNEDLYDMIINKYKHGWLD